MPHPTLTNPEKIVAAYASNVGEAIQVFEGTFLDRSGEIFPQREWKLVGIDAILEFPDRELAIALEESDQYQDILPAPQIMRQVISLLSMVWNDKLLM